jgi:hypothetical protein
METLKPLRTVGDGHFRNELALQKHTQLKGVILLGLM